MPLSLPNTMPEVSEVRAKFAVPRTRPPAARAQARPSRTYRNERGMP
jgi:hypothetical protein